MSEKRHYMTRHRSFQTDKGLISVGDFIEWKEDEGKSTIGICFKIQTIGEHTMFECLIIASSHYYPENFTPLGSHYSVAKSRILNIYKFPDGLEGFEGIQYKNR